MKHDLIVVAGWLLATAIINALLRVRSVAEWEALAETNPRFLAFARLLRSVGLDPVKLFESIVDLIRGESRRRIAPVGVTISPTESASAEPAAIEPEVAAEKVEDSAPVVQASDSEAKLQPEPEKTKTKTKKKKAQKKKG